MTKRKYVCKKFEWYHGAFGVAFILAVLFTALNTSGLVKPVDKKPIKSTLEFNQETENLVNNMILF